MNKVLACIGIVLFAFCMVALFTLLKYREQLFQVRSRLLIIWLLSAKMFFIMVHYTLGLPGEYSIVFVIIQEFFKVSTFLYVIYFYLKHAVDYSEDANGRKFIKVMRFGFSSFWLGVFVTLFIWAVMRLSNIFDEDPWRDYLWLVYRSVTLLLVISVVIAGFTIQRKVKERTKSLYGTANPAIVNPATEPSTGKFFIDKPKELGEESEQSTGQYYVTSSVLRQMNAINKSLWNMWLWFTTIILVWMFDVGYIIFWRLQKDFERCDSYTDNNAINAWIFLTARTISLIVPFFPIMYAFLGWELIKVLLWCCWASKRALGQTNENLDYSDLD